jgi:ribosomal protein S27AE
LEDASVCPRCGTAITGLLDHIPTLSVEGVEGPLVDLRCGRCGMGDLVLVTDETDIPRYRCPKCESYKGEFLHTGRETYYSTTELRVGQFIDTRLKMTGDFLLPIEDHMAYLSRKISEATNIDPEQVEKAVEYLQERRIIMIMHKGDHFEVGFR